MLTISDNDTPFSLTYMSYNPSAYDSILDDKVQTALCVLGEETIPMGHIPYELHQSSAKNYRHRCRFAIDKVADELWYTMWEHGAPNVRMDSFPLASIFINAIMPFLLDCIRSDDALNAGIRAVNFLSTSAGDVSITLIYEGHFSSSWRATAESLFHTLTARGSHITGIIGRSKGVKVVVGKEEVTEIFRLTSGRELRYVQVPDGFSNPNPEVNVKSLNWLCDVVSNIPALARNNIESSSLTSCGDSADQMESRDLLELYCGNGNHTVALAGYARYIVSVEINKVLCAAAQINLESNGIDNVTIIACDSAKFAGKILREKSCVVGRVKNEGGEVRRFGGVLVDPPRCGLDDLTRRLVSSYNDIVYISCNPEALARDLVQLCQTHEIKRFAVFDQFAYTPHLECGVHLSLKHVLDS